MRFRYSTLSIVTVAFTLITAACGTGAPPNTPTIDAPLTTATHPNSASAQDITEKRERTLQTTPTSSATPEIPAGLVPVRLVKAFDGDSGIAADDNGEFEFRLYGIDAPERDDVSRDALVRLVAELGSDLYADDRDVDRYGRRVVILRTLDGARSINVEMVRQGYAHAYLDYGVLEGVLAAAEEAKSNQRGVWAPAPTATPKAGLTTRQEEILASVHRGASLTTERLWQLTYEFIDEGRFGNYEDGYAVGYADSSGCDALLLLAQRLMDASHPALGDNILSVVVEHFGNQSSPPYTQGYLDGYNSDQGCTPWDNISPHARFSATEEGRLEVHNNALAASDFYTRGSTMVQQFMDSLFDDLNAQYVATAIFNSGEDGPTFRDYIQPSLGGKNLAGSVWWCNAFDTFFDVYNDPTTRLSRNQRAALDELRGQALNLYIQASESRNPFLAPHVRDSVNRTLRRARDANPAIGSWEFARQQGHPCSS